MKEFFSKPLFPAGRNPRFSHAEMPCYCSISHALVFANRDEREFGFIRLTQELGEKGYLPKLLRTKLPGPVSSVMLTQHTDKVVVALENQLYLAQVGLDVSDIRALPEISRKIQRDLEGKIRLNDWRADHRGRPMGGTMDVQCQSEIGCFGLVNFARDFIQLTDKKIVSNGFELLRDGETFLYVDSPKGLYRGRYCGRTESLELGDVINSLSKSSLAEFVSPHLAGDFLVGDGVAWAEWAGEEVLFVAIFNGGAVVIVHPVSGEVLGVIRVDAPLTTACCFGGPNHTTLFITTSNEGLRPDEGGPHSGNIFFLDLAEHGIVGRRAQRIDLNGFFPGGVPQVGVL